MEFDDDGTGVVERLFKVCRLAFLEVLTSELEGRRPLLWVDRLQTGDAGFEELPNRIQLEDGRFRLWGDRLKVEGGGLEELLQHSEGPRKELVALLANLAHNLEKREISLISPYIFWICSDDEVIIQFCRTSHHWPDLFAR